MRPSGIGKSDDPEPGGRLESYHEKRTAQAEQRPAFYASDGLCAIVSRLAGGAYVDVETHKTKGAR